MQEHVMTSEPGIFAILQYIKSKTGNAYTTGLTREQLMQFSSDQNLITALTNAELVFTSIFEKYQQILKLPETEAMQQIQSGILNFYSGAATSPYIPLVAKGPWIITCYGSVVYDTGGYGMMGFGHDPDAIRDVMAEPRVMANIMTPSLAQFELTEHLRKEIGQSRKGVCPFDKFVCLNSGSESMTFALRLADINARTMTDDSGRYPGWQIKRVALKGAFHGRTEGPAYVSNSCVEKYQVLASYRNYESTLIVKPNDLADLQAVFEQAQQNKHFVEFMVVEPVLGEGNPGLAITPEFYAKAQQLVEAQGGFLFVDSIQAGLRGQGYLSIVDYPGFENLPAPDAESYSKAINAGQYPLSVVALSKRAAEVYKIGVYGNTMTTNPRALMTACKVLDSLQPNLRKNIVERGKEFVDKLQILQKQYPKIILQAQGTGLLISAELIDRIKVVGKDSIEDFIRRHGVNVIHGGQNALRFTPHFAINSKEIDLILNVVEQGLKAYQ